MILIPPESTLFPYTTLFRSSRRCDAVRAARVRSHAQACFIAAPLPTDSKMSLAAVTPDSGASAAFPANRPPLPAHGIADVARRRSIQQAAREGFAAAPQRSIAWRSAGGGQETAAGAPACATVLRS